MQEIKFITRTCPFGEFYQTLITEFAQYIPSNSSAYYIWAEPLDTLDSILSKLKIDSQLVFLFIPDNLTNCNFTPHKDQRTWGANVILNLISTYPEIKFVLVTDVIGLGKEFGEIDNLSIVETSLIAMDKTAFCNTEPVLDKNFNSTKHVLMLNNRASIGRVTAISYLIGANIARCSNITISKDFERLGYFDDYLSFSPWLFMPQHRDVLSSIEYGFKQLKTLPIYNDNTTNADRHANYAGNYNSKLKSLSRDTFVEIVSETYYEEPSFMVTEKTLQSIKSCNFPIILCGAGAVSHLEELGFDMFRDVIDHSYDEIKNPIDRLVAALDLNRKLLLDHEFAKQQWTRCRDRFLQNIFVSKTAMYDAIYNKALCQFKGTLAQSGLDSIA